MLDPEGEGEHTLTLLEARVGDGEAERQRGWARWCGHVEKGARTRDASGSRTRHVAFGGEVEAEVWDMARTSEVSVVGMRERVAGMRERARRGRGRPSLDGRRDGEGERGRLGGGMVVV